MLAQNICLNCKKNSCEILDYLCETCDNEYKGWTEMDKTETHNKRDKKGNKVQRKCIVKIRKLKNDYRALKIIQRDIENLKKKVISLQMDMEKVHDRMECLEQNRHNEKIKTATHKIIHLSASTPISRPTGRIQCRDTYRNVSDQFSPINLSFNSSMSSPVNPTSTPTKKSDQKSDQTSSSAEDEDVNEQKLPSKHRKLDLYSSSIDNRRIPESCNPSTCSSSLIYFFFVMVVALISYQTFFGNNADPAVAVSIVDLKKNFPRQQPDTWNAIESGIHDVTIMDKPSVFLIVYNERTEHVLNEFIRNVSVFASCVLNNNCSVSPAELKGEKLSDSQIEDYGILIDKYHSPIEEKSVMIVHNLEAVPGELAQAFHAFCDEYNPLVKKSVYFFTMKIEEEEGSTTSDIERILRRKWYTLKNDIFDPLFTRISSMVIVVQPEDN